MNRRMETEYLAEKFSLLSPNQDSQSGDEQREGRWFRNCAHISRGGELHATFRPTTEADFEIVPGGYTGEALSHTGEENRGDAILVGGHRAIHKRVRCAAGNGAAGDTTFHEFEARPVHS